MGIVVLYRLAGSAPFTATDLSLARDFAARAAVPVDNARLYTPRAGHRAGPAARPAAAPDP